MRNVDHFAQILISVSRERYIQVHVIKVKSAKAHTSAVNKPNSTK